MGSRNGYDRERYFGFMICQGKVGQREFRGSGRRKKEEKVMPWKA